MRNTSAATDEINVRVLIATFTFYVSRRYHEALTFDTRTNNSMNWIKHVIVDLAVSVLIVLAALLGMMWAKWIVLIYTPLMLILKIVAFLGSNTIGQLKQKATGVPGWFYHVLYAVNVLISGMAAFQGGEGANQWWLIAGGWGLIWLLSIATDLRTRPVKR